MEKNTIKKAFFYLLMFILSLCGCYPEAITPIFKPANFKAIIPYDVNRKGIIIKTYWGKDRKEHLLYWDNDSPTTANEKIINDNSSVSKSSTFKYRTTTSDGATIRGDVYVCDEIECGNEFLGSKILFNNVPVYAINDKQKSIVQDTINGYFGIDLIAKGVWEIDFKRYVITFASSIDSLQGDLSKADILPTEFKSNTFEIPVTFSNNQVCNFQVDFGFNGCVIMPLSAFKKAIPENKMTNTASLVFSSATTANIVEHTEVVDTVAIAKKQTIIAVATNAAIKEMLIGRGFFNRYEFVIFDYPNKKMYVSKKVLF